MTHTALASALAGRFIVLDGPDGSGKTTQFNRLVATLRGVGAAVADVREPGGTPVGEQIREILLHPSNEIGMRCEMLLYMASRAQLVEEKIRPALERGEAVIADRFVSSTLAYQGLAGGLPAEEILAVYDIARDGVRPDLVALFDVNADTAAARRKATPDRIEFRDSEYHRRVREGYLEQAAQHPERYIVIDASPDEDAVFEGFVSALLERFASARRA